MKKLVLPLIIIFLIFYLYQMWTVPKNRPLENTGGNSTEEIIMDLEQSLINPPGKTIIERIKVPEGFQRVEPGEGSFGDYLRDLPLKPHGSPVCYYNGKEKTKNVYAAVVDMDIGDRDLQQCADAVMRLRAEYLYHQEQYDKIHFNFVSGFSADYGKWMQGNRIVVNGNQVNWVKKTGYSNSYESFRNYLNMVFAYAGTASLAKELKPLAVEEMQIGDIFIQGGSPGHCVIVVDMAENESTGQKLFILAQSYMPAQDIQILINPLNEKISPWYELDFGHKLITPEWEFNEVDLKRFN